MLKGDEGSEELIWENELSQLQIIEKITELPKTVTKQK